MNAKAHKPLRSFSHKMLLILAILGGWLFIMALEYLLGTRAGLLKAKARLETENAYIAAQCIRYDEVSAEEKTKSLIRIADKALRFQRIYREDDGNLNEEYFLEYMESFRLTGIILTEDGNETGLRFFRVKGGCPGFGLKSSVYPLRFPVAPAKCIRNAFFMTTVITTITRWFPDWTNPA